MPPKDMYKDDNALSNFLDNLIGAGQTQINPSLNSSPLHTSPLSPTITFDTNQLGQAISLANEHLSQGRQFSLLPSLTRSQDNLSQILAASLSTIIRLSKCCQANLNLRQQAEHLTQETQLQVQHLSQALEATKEKVEKKESALAQSKAHLVDAETKSKRRIRQLVAENTELKKLVTNATHRENHLHLEAKKREKQFSLLQQRVHTLMSSTRKLSIEQDVTPGERSRLRLERAPQRKCHDKEQTDNESMHVRAVGVAVLEENRLLKALIRDVHLELDDMFRRFPRAFAFLCEDHSEQDESSQVSDEEENTYRIPAPAPTEERMNLPYDVIREEIESSLDDKLNALRSALSSCD